jgi:predicted site-specific integrase-resolvase
MSSRKSKPPPATPGTWLAPKQAAQALGGSTFTVLRLMKEGKIPHRCVPGMRRRWVEAEVVEKMKHDSYRPATSPV